LVLKPCTVPFPINPLSVASKQMKYPVKRNIKSQC
jgi:hypothetical protein